MYDVLFTKISNVAAISENLEETWASLNINGHYRQRQSKTVFTELFEVLTGMSKGDCFSFKTGKTLLQADEIEDILVDGVQWTVNINKQSFMGTGEEICNFFYDISKFRHWAEATTPFSTNNPFNSHQCKIEVNGLQAAFGGHNFIVSSHIEDWPETDDIDYKKDYLPSVVRQFTLTRKEMQPERHYVSFGNVDENSRPFYRNSLMCLSMALCDELYEDKVVLRGIRRLEFSLQRLVYEDVHVIKAQNDLREAFCWVFDDDSRFELRHKLLMDRLTLDLPLEQPYYQSMLPVVGTALQQARERYNYAFFERSNEYQKELQQFLKDLHGLSDSYASKVRSLLGNFLRDALAGFLTVAITMFLKAGDLGKLGSEKVLTYVFTAYGSYLIVSCIFQIVVDWSDLALSEKEIDYWKKASREYMREDDFTKHKDATVGKRKCRTIIQYIMVAVLYIALAVFSFKTPRLWGKLSQDEIPVETQTTPVEAIAIPKDSIETEILENGKDTISGNGDTTVYHTPSREQK